jgi:hypothetical protein
MNTKLTLNIDDSVIEKAKSYAKSRRRSVSKLVEEYLFSISNNKRITNERNDYSPITEELLGMVKLSSSKKVEYKKLLEEALTEKYL